MAFGQGVPSSVAHLLSQLLLEEAAPLWGFPSRARGHRFLTTLCGLATDLAGELKVLRVPLLSFASLLPQNHAMMLNCKLQCWCFVSL